MKQKQNKTNKQTKTTKQKQINKQKQNKKQNKQTNKTNMTIYSFNETCTLWRVNTLAHFVKISCQKAVQ